MNQRFLVRAGLLCAGAMFLGACASTSGTDPADLPPEATVDDGIDYYSAGLSAADPSVQELLNYTDNQWVTDDEGNRVYRLQRLRRGRTTSYYVGDIRFIYAYDNVGGPVGTAFGDTPVYTSQGGAPLQSPAVRGMRDDTYYQSRRGRIVYLPNAPRPTTTSTPNNGEDSTPNPTQNNAPVPATTSGTPSPRPATTPARPATPTPSPRVTSPRTKPQSRKRPSDSARRPDR